MGGSPAIDYVAEAMVELKERAGSLRELRIVEGPPALRHFTCRFEEPDRVVFLHSVRRASAEHAARRLCQ